MSKIALRLRSGIAPLLKRSAIGLIFILPGCSTEWMPGPGQTASGFEPAKANCQLEAQNSGTSFVAAGSQNYVAGAALGHAVGDAIRARTTFKACMTAAGFVEARPERVSQIAFNREQATQNAQQLLNATELAKACTAAVREKPRYVSLLLHFAPVGSDRFTIQQLANENKATGDESRAMIAYADEVEPCRNQARQAILDAAPSSGPAMLLAKQQTDHLILQLVHRDITWGQYADGSKAITSSLTAALRSPSAR